MTLVFDRVVWRVVLAAIGSHRARAIAVLVCAACACTPASAFAALTPNNAAATRAYLRIVADQQRVANSDFVMGVAAVQALERQVTGECPGALAYAPRDVAYEEIGEVVEYTLSIVGTNPLLPQGLSQARAIGALSWSNHRLTQLVRDRAVEELAYETYAPPNLCAQIAAWRESAYASLPASSGRFLAAMHASEPELFVGPHEEVREQAITRLLKPYERPAERRFAENTQSLENRIANQFSAAKSSAEKQLAAALGVAEL
jgi:hypothetical protein